VILHDDGMQRIEIVQDFHLPVSRVYAYLAEHENLAKVFGAKVSRVRDGDTTRNGAGSVRRLKVGPLPAFEETVTEAVPDQLIAYRITKGSPLRGHSGRLSFAEIPGGSRLTYIIEFGMAVPGLDRIVKLGLERQMRRGLAGVEAQA
jgi:uncharacterized protein YndB with AHSA1/START domain